MINTVNFQGTYQKGSQKISTTPDQDKKFLETINTKLVSDLKKPDDIDIFLDHNGGINLDTFEIVLRPGFSPVDDQAPWSSMVVSAEDIHQSDKLNVTVKSNDAPNDEYSFSLQKDDLTKSFSENAKAVYEKIADIIIKGCSIF